jgi:hypothetical protein
MPTYTLQFAEHAAFCERGDRAPGFEYGEHRVEIESWREVWRIVAWAPDQARDLVVAGEGEVASELDHARAADVLAKVFAVTGAWPLAREAYDHAAESWASLDPARALCARAIAARLPLRAFAGDGEAIAVELDLVARCVRGEAVTLRRSLVEIQRALHPLAITGRIEAAFRLSPGELALVMAAMASVIGDELRTVEEWQRVLAVDDGIERLVELGVASATPMLVPHPTLASRLLGRTTIEQPRGIRLDLVPTIGRPPREAADLARALARGGIGVIYGAPRSGRRTYGAHVAGRTVLAARRVAGDPDITGALREAALHDATVAIDLDEWGLDAIDAFDRNGALIAVSRENPAIPNERRAFTIRTWRDGVSSPR